MTKEEIRQKAVECGNAYYAMCMSKEDCSECEYNKRVMHVSSCHVVYGYEHGFADGVAEGEKQMTGIIIRNVITSLEEIEKGYRTLGEYIEQLKGKMT